MAGLSCALSGASCCVLPTYFEATRFLSSYCGALCFIFCQVIIKDCPDIYSYFSSSTECLNFSHHNVCWGVTCMAGHLREWRRDRYRTGQHSTNDVHTSLEKKTIVTSTTNIFVSSRLVNESSNRFSDSFYLERSVFVTS